ncbi:MAG TPA: hypothetical protein VMW42_00945 [Desulfatiglandales bacterium]|nr:hypothetical protein [Desulfatiglandales bacterium]
MKPRSKILSMIFLSLCMGIFLFSFQAYAAKPVAKISGFKGEVIIQSGTMVSRLDRMDLILNDGDRVQTKQGEVEITFNDGALMKLRPFTATMIQEREEKSGIWIFKTKKTVRRITCFVGKLWFKSGLSGKKNYLQTPTAVCGVRGSEGDVGYDNVNTYLNMYVGDADVLGNVIKGFFEDPGIDEATKNMVYQALAGAYDKAGEAASTGKAIDLAEARLAALQVVQAVAAELQNNPDETVNKEALVAANVANANIAAAEAAVAVEELIEAGASAADIQIAQDAAAIAQSQAEIANEAADRIYVDGVLDPSTLDQAIQETETAADNARNAAIGATSIRDQVVPPAGPPPGEPPPEEPPPEEPPPDVEPPDTETTEQEEYLEEVSPSQ